MGFGVWLVGVADQPYPKISFFRRLRRVSGQGFHKASDFVKTLICNPNDLAWKRALGHNTFWRTALKILAVSDMVVDRLYSTQVAERFRDVQMILGCGDLPNDYLEFLVTSMNVPLLYVPGNHDPACNENITTARAPGCDCLDGKVKSVKGLNIAGIGGSIRYRPGAPNQYTQSQMYSRLSYFAPRLLWYLARHGKILDIFIAHSPPRDIHDDDDQAHVGFSAFRDLIQTFKPRFFLHGHTMVYKSNITVPITEVGTTTVINVYPYRVIEI
jgi:Icc-related predicted phosphoesterase